ncbi:MAG: aspartate/glutamate racemase family protein [Lentisphaeria bacterium]|nr:aspartate/glutamate racemase family protein [Lentisphaeria bacterium]
MKRIIVCDSGLGGLNIASHFFKRPETKDNGCELIYFNAYPSASCGFNKLPSPRAQEEVFQNVLEGMKKFSPDLCLIACNTLSIVYERLKKYYTPAFPVQGIIGAAAEGMFSALERVPEASLLILGTKSTVESGVYAQKLIEKGISPGRIRSLACPQLATALESNPTDIGVFGSITGFALKSVQLFDRKPEKLFLGLCCTHFAFASGIWLKAFSRAVCPDVELIDPNELFDADFCAKSFTYKSKIKFFPGSQKSMCKYFQRFSPAIASALRSAVPDSELFDFKEEDFK